jgi:hypothetical protein
MGGSSGSGTKTSTTTKARNVAASMAKRKVKVVGLGRCCDEAPGQSAEPDAQVPGDPLQRIGGMPSRRRGEAGEKGGLRRPEAPISPADDGHGEEGLPGLVHKREVADAQRHRHQRPGERQPSADAVGEPAGDRAGEQAEDPVRRERETGDPERETADVVEIDDDERKRDPVPERVDEPARLQRPDGARKPRVDRPQICDQASSRSHA